MLIYTYRYLRKKWQSRRNASGTQATADNPVQDAQRDEADHAQLTADGHATDPGVTASTGNRRTILFQLMLMGGLAIPVFLETLDYTGKSALTIALLTSLIYMSTVVATAQVHIAVRHMATIATTYQQS